MYSWYLYIYFFKPSPIRISFFGYWKPCLFINSYNGECHNFARPPTLLFTSSVIQSSLLQPGTIWLWRASCCSCLLLSQINQQHVHCFFCLFLSTYLPFVFSLVVATAIGFSSFPQLFALDITSFLALLNSSLNPVVYCWRIKEIQREAKQLIRNSHSCYSIILGRFFQSRVMPLNTSQGVQPV